MAKIFFGHPTPNQLQATLTRSSGDLIWVFRYRGFLIRNNQWHRHAFQVRSLDRDMLLCLRLKHLSAPNDPSWVLSGKGMHPNRLQVTLTGLQVQGVSDQKQEQWHRHALQVRSLGRDMLLSLRLKHSSALNDPSWVLSGKDILWSPHPQPVTGDLH